MFTNTKRTGARLWRDERGNVAILFGLMIIPIGGIMGLAVDYSQAIRTQVRMQAASDLAALAFMNARDLDNTQRIALAEATYKSNVSPDNPDGVTNPVVEIGAGGNSVTITASSSVATSLSALFGIEEFNVGVESGAAVETTGFKAEVSMMVDLTGSMGSTRNGSTKIAGLRLAADDLLDILLPTSGANDGLVKVAIAPFADYVNAGSYAAAATGLSLTGVYNNIYNLASTRNGPFSGSYTGSVVGSAAGSQSGATSATSTTAGATYDNRYCANPTLTTTTTTNVTRTGRINGQNYTWNVAASYDDRYYNGATWGYFWVENYRGIPGNWAYGQMYYKPKTTTTSTTSTVAGCEPGNTNLGKLVTCVTERTDSTTRYTDDLPAVGKYIGAYNQSASGVINKLNYSSDGKCYTSGRELPSVIPLTDDRETLETFFSTATIGGGTPGHLGTAWAWYLLSPVWNSVFGTTAADYGDTGTKKFAILMTDGEYNMQYSSNTARTQALALCSAMKEKGIKVFTIGFGFDPNSTAGANTTEGKAKELLQTCASDSSSYYFPYDGDALRQTFQNIGNTITSNGAAGTTVRLTN